MAKLLSIATYGYTILIIVASLGKFVSGFFTEEVEHSDKIGHFMAYAGFTVVWIAFLIVVKKQRVTKSYWLGVIWSIFFGILMEFCQWIFTSYRQFDYYDMLANTLGSFLGLLLFGIFFVIIRKKTSLDF